MKGYNTSNGYMGYVEGKYILFASEQEYFEFMEAQGGKIMFGFDKMFDFNRDGKLDSWERAAQFQFMDEMMKDDEKSILDDDDEIDTFADAGLDYDELEFMDLDERREVLEDAGLDPDEFDF